MGDGIWWDGMGAREGSWVGVSISGHPQANLVKTPTEQKPFRAHGESNRSPAKKRSDGHLPSTQWYEQYVYPLLVKSQLSLVIWSSFQVFISACCWLNPHFQFGVPRNLNPHEPTVGDSISGSWFFYAKGNPPRSSARSSQRACHLITEDPGEISSGALQWGPDMFVGLVPHANG